MIQFQFTPERLSLLEQLSSWASTLNTARDLNETLKKHYQERDAKLYKEERIKSLLDELNATKSKLADLQVASAINGPQEAEKQRRRADDLAKALTKAQSELQHYKLRGMATEPILADEVKSLKFELTNLKDALKRSRADALTWENAARRHSSSVELRDKDLCVAKAQLTEMKTCRDLWLAKSRELHNEKTTLEQEKAKLEAALRSANQTAMSNAELTSSRENLLETATKDRELWFCKAEEWKKRYDELRQELGEKCANLERKKLAVVNDKVSLQAALDAARKLEPADLRRQLELMTKMRDEAQYAATTNADRAFAMHKQIEESDKTRERLNNQIVHQKGRIASLEISLRESTAACATLEAQLRVFKDGSKLRDLESQLIEARWKHNHQLQHIQDITLRNTQESLGNAVIDEGDAGWTPAYQAVVGAIKREIAERDARQKAARLLAEAHSIQFKLETALGERPTADQANKMREELKRLAARLVEQEKAGKLTAEDLGKLNSNLTEAVRDQKQKVERLASQLEDTKGRLKGIREHVERVMGVVSPHTSRMLQ